MNPASTTPAPQRADARRNRERIVAAARSIVAERGVEAQIQDVACEAGVGVGTVYRHFPTKDALMGELLALCIRELVQAAREVSAVEDPWEAFAALVRTGCEAMEADAAKRRMWQAASDAAVVRAAEAKAELRAEFSAIIDRAHAAGVLRADFTGLDMPGLMCALGAVIDQPGQSDWRRLVEFALDGLRTRPI